MKTQRWIALVVLGGLMACGRSRTPPAAEWTLAGPLVDIGEAGDSLYTLEAIGSVRLDDGRIVVLDGRTAEVRMYDEDGIFLLATGGRGEGPDAFRRPGRLRLSEADSLIVEDPVLRRSFHLDTRGRLVSSEPWAETTEPFPREVWLYDRAIIDGPAPPRVRGDVRRVLDGLPPPARYRQVIVDAYWRIWVSEAGASWWDVHDATGDHLAGIRMPAGFEPQQIGPDFVVGRVRGDRTDRVQLYAIEGAPEEAGPDVARLAREDEEPPPAPDPSPEVRARLRAAVERVRDAQERRATATNGFRYAPSMDVLGAGAATEGAAVFLRDVRQGGYTVIAFDPTGPAACGLTVGTDGPIGWPPGVALCT